MFIWPKTKSVLSSAEAEVHLFYCCLDFQQECHISAPVTLRAPSQKPSLIGQLVNSKCERQKVHSFMLFCTCACWLSVKNTQKPNFPGGTVNTVNRNQMLTKITNDGVMTNILIDKFLKKYVRHPETTRRSERK